MSRLLLVDYETDSRSGTHIQRPVCATLCWQGGKPWILRAEETADFLAAELERDTRFVSHNAPFDWATLMFHRPQLRRAIFDAFERDRIYCTQTRQELLDVREGLASDSADGDDGDSGAMRLIFRKDLRTGLSIRSGYSLADLTFYYLGRDRYAEKKDPNSPRLRFHEVAGLPVSAYPKEFTDYALADADALDVFEAQGPAVPDEHRQVRAALCLFLIRARGMAVDGARTQTLKALATAEFDAIRAKMTEQGFYRGEGGIDPDTGKPWKAARIGSKNKAVIEAAVVAAYKAKGVAAPRNAPTARFPDGSIKTDKDALKNSGDPLLAELSGAGPLGTVVNTFLPLLESAVNGRVHTQYKNLLATGRISSSKPNLNNIPRGSVVEGVGVRECFVPSPGMHLLSTDYDCAELRSHAQVNYALFGRSAARDFFCADPKGDPHLGLAASIQGLSYEEAKARKAELKGLRQMCKAPNFGLPGGMGIARFIESARKGYGVTLTEAQAKQLKAQWHRRWPEMRRYFEYVTALTERQGYVKQWAPSWAGEHRVRGRNPQEANRWFSQVANTLFQGLTADGAKDALWRVTRACYVEESSPLYGSFPVGFLYDEVLTEVPEERSHEAGYEQARLMVEGMQRWTPDVPATVSPALMTSWQKNAEEVVVGGKLVPWFPTKSV